MVGNWHYTGFRPVKHIWQAFEDYSFVSRTLIEEENPYESLERYLMNTSHILLYDDTRNLILQQEKPR